MTLAEKIAADKANSQVTLVAGFSNSFRSNELNNLEDGDIITIPEGDLYQVCQRKIGDRVAEYINVNTNSGRQAQFYPTSMTRIAFEVDENGKNVRVGGRMKVIRSTGDVVDYIAGKEIDGTMRKLQGCQLQYNIVKRVKTRAFGVQESVATSKDVTETIIGKWSFYGDKRPTDYVAK